MYDVYLSMEDWGFVFGIWEMIIIYRNAAKKVFPFANNGTPGKLNLFNVITRETCALQSWIGISVHMYALANRTGLSTFSLIRYPPGTQPLESI